MFNVCSGCGEYSVEKTIDPRIPVAYAHVFGSGDGMIVLDDLLNAGNKPSVSNTAIDPNLCV